MPPKTTKNLVAEAAIERTSNAAPAIASAKDRHVPFRDVYTGKPCLAVEYMLGAPGMPIGKVIVFRGYKSSGKSSFAYNLQASAKLMADAWTLNINSETESNHDHLMIMGADGIVEMNEETDELSGFNVVDTGILENVMGCIDYFSGKIRGAYKETMFGKVIDPTEKEGSKGDYDYSDPKDRKMERPIIVAIDSLSSLAPKDGVIEDMVDGESNPGAYGSHVKIFRDWMSRRKSRCNKTDVSMIFVLHPTSVIDQGSRFKKAPEGDAGPGDDKTSRYGKAIWQYTDIGLDFTEKAWKEEEVTNGMKRYKIVGLIANVKVRKNKDSGAINREVNLYKRSMDCFDYYKTDWEFLTNPETSPFDLRSSKLTERELYKHANGVVCKLLKANDGKFKTENDFLDALYDDEGVMMELRNRLEIWGFDLPFEKARICRQKALFKRPANVPPVIPTPTEPKGQ